MLIRRIRTCTGGIIEVTVLANVARSSTVIILTRTVTGNYFADTVEGTQRIAFASCKLRMYVNSS